MSSTTFPPALAEARNFARALRIQADESDCMSSLRAVQAAELFERLVAECSGDADSGAELPEQLPEASAAPPQPNQVPAYRQLNSTIRPHAADAHTPAATPGSAQAPQAAAVSVTPRPTQVSPLQAQIDAAVAKAITKAAAHTADDAIPRRKYAPHFFKPGQVWIQRFSGMPFTVVSLSNGYVSIRGCAGETIQVNVDGLAECYLPESEFTKRGLLTPANLSAAWLAQRQREQLPV